jgi:hypothetical protein
MRSAISSLITLRRKYRSTLTTKYKHQEILVRVVAVRFVNLCTSGFVASRCFAGLFNIVTMLTS